jgi:predicted HTH transcriptional regulator
MIVIRTDDRENYLKVLHECDDLCGKIPFDGANASIEQTKPLIDYISTILENKLETLIKFVKGKIPDFIEAKDDPVNVSATVEKAVEKAVEKVLNAIQNNPKITQAELAKITGLSRRGVEWNIAKLKNDGKIERVGGDRGGYWKIIQ